MSELVVLSRDCEVTEIPSGRKATLPKGIQVRITQSLGESFTIVTDDGYMARVSGKDADAIGKVGTGLKPATTFDPNRPLEELVMDQLKTCYDPEIPVNIVDLGLIYDCKITPLETVPGTVIGYRADVKLTLTAPGCGMGEVLKKDAESKIERLPGVKEAHVELVWEPPWDQSRMSEAAKLKLGLM
jgi:probable FeS assembly SUF system protein SufT